MRKVAVVWLQWGLLFLLLSGCVTSVPRSTNSWQERSSLVLRARLRDEGIHVGGEFLAADELLSAFYLRRADQLAWCTPAGPRVQADQLVAALAQARGDGLDPEAYYYSKVVRALSAWRAPTGLVPDLEALVELDLLLSNAFLHYGTHLQRGRIAPRRIHAHWTAPYIKGALGDLLETALALNRVQAALDGLRPPQQGYARLRTVLMHYRALSSNGGWPRVDGSGQGLSQRLKASGDLDSTRTLREAVERFQARRGLPPSGRIDPATLRALNEPIESAIAKIELNMERWRWLPHSLDARYVLVRLDDYELDVILEGKMVHTARVIVGKEFWRTPIFSAVMTHLVINPYWYVPRSIAVGEILPLLKRDGGYMQRNGFRVSRGQDLETVAVDPAKVDWSKVEETAFAYNFVQEPGPANPLGVVKFILPNPHNIYLHDTPHRALFAREQRAFSHGCIRVEDSTALAALLLDGWTLAEVEAQVLSGQNRQVSLARPLPVFMLYWTAWVGEDLLLHLREDSYQSDELMRSALAEK
jgi:L,D-transpeptidase YcbB